MYNGRYVISSLTFVGPISCVRICLVFKNWGHGIINGLSQVTGRSGRVCRNQPKKENRHLYNALLNAYRVRHLEARPSALLDVIDDALARALIVIRRPVGSTRVIQVRREGRRLTTGGHSGNSGRQPGRGSFGTTIDHRDVVRAFGITTAQLYPAAVRQCSSCVRQRLRPSLKITRGK